GSPARQALVRIAVLAEACPVLIIPAGAGSARPAPSPRRSARAGACRVQARPERMSFVSRITGATKAPGRAMPAPGFAEFVGLIAFMMALISLSIDNLLP